jgi:transglutaminase-like putative cysteine protease
MTAAVQPATITRPARPLPSAPSEGWLSVGLLFVMLVSLAWAVDEARWAGVTATNRSQTDFLIWAVVLSAVWGFITAKLPISPLKAHAAGATLGAFFLILAVAGVVGETGDLERKIEALNLSLARFHHDLFVEGIRSRETSVFLMGLGAVGWTTGQFAAFNIFRRHRALDTVFITGLLMLAQVSLTILAQYTYLIVFTAAALLLVVRMNMLDQRTAWLRRHIGDTQEISGLYMRGGLAFVGVALIGAVFLAATASSAPLARFWRNVDNDLVRWGNELNRVLGGVTGAARGPSGLFGSSQLIRGFWESSDAPVFRARTSTGEGYYWRAATYDGFDGNSWLQVERTQATSVAAGSPLLEGTPEAVAPGPGRDRVEIAVSAIDLAGDLIVAPESPLSVDRNAQLYTNTPNGPLAAIQAADPIGGGEVYNVVALVRREAQVRGGEIERDPNIVTGNRLAAASTDYPAWTDRYLEIRPNSIGPGAAQTANAVVASLPREKRDPFHVAEAIQNYLYEDGGFTYRTDVRGLCGSEKLVDCFLRTKVGYCEYFATTMAMMLRTQEIPARLAMGYLPGQRLTDGTWRVDRGAAHAWVEVFFPGYGWIRFDPTPGNTENRQRPTRFEAGPPVPTPIGGLRSPVTGRDDIDDPTRRGSIRDGSLPAAGTVDTPTTPGDAGPFAVLVPLLLIAGAGVVLLWGRSRRAPAPEPEVAYRGVTRLATRLGYGPRPTQTAYEYTAVLSDLVPRVRNDLHLVARAKVQATYAPGGTVLEPLRGLRDAYRRIRFGLLRLAVRRRRRTSG